MKIAFQGEYGAYSEMAVFEHWTGEFEPVPCPSFEDVFARVSAGQCQRGLLPIENSLAGSIHRNYDLLLHNALHVVGEHSLRVSHCLIALPGTRLEDVKRVISHPQALAQCEGYLRSLRLEAEPVYDTAGSVKMVKERGDPTTAAIASHRAAGLYGMTILAEHIEDNPNNYTRFLVVAAHPVDPGPDAKTSIVYSLNNVPGALFRSLSVFALRDIDLTKIESRPLVGKLWDYYFYVDFAGSTRDPNVQRALANLEEYATLFRILGSYPRFR